MWHTVSAKVSYQSVQLIIRKQFYLIYLKIGSAAGSEALLTAEALQLAPHAQRIALDSDFLAPGAHDLHVGCIFIWKQTTVGEK